MGHIPEVGFANLFTEDPLAEPFFAARLGSDWPRVRDHFVALGEAGALAAPLSARADREGPRLEARDARGEPLDRVVYHPDYRRLEALSYARGIVAAKYEAPLATELRYRRHLVGFGAGYFFAQGEMGLYCPICMTDGVGRVLERHAPPGGVFAEALARIGSRDPATLWQGAMFLTEKAGGSDVGAAETVARRDGERWLLDGEKWFASNVDAEAILALARMPDGPAGTRGLGLFLVLRDRPEGNHRSFRIHRLKEKLGVRSMPTGEVTFAGTEAHLVGGVGHGFKQMAEMLNLSRLYNAVASVAAMKRALSEALRYGAGRRAFDRPLVELPLWRGVVADLVAEQLGHFLLVFETVTALDRADAGDDAARRLVRLLTPIAKATTGKLAIWGVSEAMEAVGGNGYIEESPLPRLLRDAQVLPIWEGTTNVLCLDALRALAKEASWEPFEARLRELEGTARRVDGTLAAELATRIGGLATELGRLQSLPRDDQERAARGWLESAGRTMALGLLLEAEPVWPGVAAAAARRFATRPFPTAPAGAWAEKLRESEAPLLRAASLG